MHTTESRPSSREREKGRDGEEVVALSRGLDVLRRIAAADAPVSNRELAEWTGIPKPTISRLTATLVGANLLFQLPDSERFVLTASVLDEAGGLFIEASRTGLANRPRELGRAVGLELLNKGAAAIIERSRPR